MTTLARPPRTADANGAHDLDGTPPALRVDRRPTCPGDLPFLRDLFAESRHDLLLTPDVRDVVLDTRFREHRRRLRADHPRAVHDVLVVDGRPVGRLVVDEGAPGTDPTENPQLIIVDLAVGLSWRGRGIGAAAVAAVVAQAAGRGVRLLGWTGAAHARRFCLRHGFTAVTPSGDLVRVRPPA